MAPGEGVEGVRGEGGGSRVGRDDGSLTSHQTTRRPNHASPRLSSVDGEINHDGRVQVQVYRDNGTIWAILPTEYRDSVAVSEADLVA